MEMETNGDVEGGQKGMGIEMEHRNERASSAGITMKRAYRPPRGMSGSGGSSRGRGRRARQDDDEEDSDCVCRATSCCDRRLVLEMVVLAMLAVYHVHSLNMCESRARPIQMFNTHPPSMMRQLPPTSPTSPASPLPPPSIASAASTQSSSMFSSMFLNSRSVAAPAPLDQSGRIPTPCGAQPLFVAQIEYPDAKYSLSVHHPADDNVISKSLLEGSKKYGSISQVYTICHYSGQNEGGATYRIACGGNKTFFEVGSALGHVAMYMAAKGMMVVAVDPLKPNMERLRESLCLNGIEVCLKESGVREEERSGGGGGGGALQDRAAKCAARGKNWGNYGHDRVQMINALISGEVSESVVKVSNNPLNLAATNKGGGGVTSEVTTTTIDQVMGESGEIELLLLTCQGFEYQALVGAKKMLSSGRVKNVIVRMHARGHAAGQSELNKKIVAMLQESGFNIFELETMQEADKKGALKPPVLLSTPETALAYAGGVSFTLNPSTGRQYTRTRTDDEHPNIFASLKEQKRG